MFMERTSIISRIGQDVSMMEGESVVDVFKATKLNWKVVQKPVYTADNNYYESIPNLVANYRDDTNQFLGVVNPKSYKIVQNIDAFNFIDELDNFSLNKVGEFNGGKKVYVVGKSTERNITLDGNDTVDMYFTFLHGHDGKSSIKFIICPIRMFCTNQLNLMLNTADFKYNIAHTGNIDIKLEQIHKAINNSNKYISNLEDKLIKMMVDKPSMTIDAFTNTLIPDSDDDNDRAIAYKNDVRAAIIDIYKNKDDLQNYRNTTFAYINAVSDYVSHATPRRNSNSTNTLANMFIKNIETNNLITKAQTILDI